LKRVVEEAMNSLMVVDPSEENDSPEETAEPSFSSRLFVTALTENHTNTGSAAAPTTPLRLGRDEAREWEEEREDETEKEKEDASSEDEYIMVNSAAVEVNAIADVLNRAPLFIVSLKTTSPPSIFSRSMMSESPPVGMGIQSGSPPSPSSSPTSVGLTLTRGNPFLQLYVLHK